MINATNCMPRRVEPHVKAKIGESWHSHGANEHGGVCSNHKLKAAIQGTQGNETTLFLSGEHFEWTRNVFC